MKKQKKNSPSTRRGRGLLIIITAAILIELIAGVQYYQTHNILENHLEKRAENELTLKAILIKGTLNVTEDLLKSNIEDIQSNLSRPDSLFGVVKRMALSRYVQGCFVAFVPHYYPEKGELFEPYAQHSGESMRTEQIANEVHDYTKRLFYQKALETDEAIWVNPYEDKEGAKTTITSYVTRIRDASGAIAGVAGVDVSLEWLADTIDKRHILPTSFNLLLTEDGEVIAKPASSRISNITSEYYVHLINDSTVKRSKSGSGRSKLIRFKHDGKKGTIYYANMKGTPRWQIAVVCYDNEVYGELNLLRQRMLLFMLIAFGILLFMIRRFARSEEELKMKTQEQERLAGELLIASNIQKALLPTHDPQLANLKDISVKGLQLPAKAVGGDLYNAFIRDDKLFFCIGDVSGKGIPSALLMAITQSLFRNIASRENDPAHIMRQMNETACRNNKENYFVTLFIGVLDLPSGNLRFCNAGHEVPFIIREKTGNGIQPIYECEMMEVKANLPIGLFDDYVYEKQKYKMEKGSALFLYTDGLTEARNIKNEQFGKNRVCKVLSSSLSTDPEQLVEKVVKELSLFTQDAEQADDLTLLTFSYTPMEEELLLDETLTLQNDVQQVDELNTFMKGIMTRLHIGNPLAKQLRLAMEEAVVNVMEYAYPAGSRGKIDIRVTSDRNRMKYIIIDSGIPFNPTEASTADTTLTAEERPVGGLGILLVRKLMDSINYERIDGKNVLTLRKDLTKQHDNQ